MLKSEGKAAKRTRGGKRCAVGDCTNGTRNEGNEYTVYSTQNVKDEKTAKKWMEFISKSRKNFDKRRAITGYVCDGHFLDDDFDSSQKMRFFSGARSKAPELKEHAVPSVVKASLPHFPKGDYSAMSLEEMKAASSKNELMFISKSPVADSKDQPKAKKKRRSAHLVLKKLRQSEEYGSTSTAGQSSQTAEEDDSTSHLQMETDELDVSRMSKAYAPKPSCKHKYIQCRPKFRSKCIQVGESFVTSTQATPLPLPVVSSTGHPKIANTPPPTTSSIIKETWSEEHVAEEKDDCDGATAGDKNEDDCATDDIEDGGEEEDESEDEVLSSSGDSDPDWDPTEWGDEEVDLDDEVEVEEPYVKIDDPFHEPKYIVYQEQLVSLFKLCGTCRGSCDVTLLQPKSYGGMVRVKSICDICNNVKVWESQPRIGDVPAGNLLLSSGVLFGGESPAKFFRTLKNMNISAITARTFHNHQVAYLQPAVISSWRVYQTQLFAELKAKGEPLVLGGDGRADSPGHSAKYGTYTMMDLTSGKVLDLQIVQSNEVKNSNAMELEGLQRSLKLLQDEGLEIGTLITDRHPSIQKYMKEQHPHIIHRYDVWHIAKGVKKKLIAAAKMKECEEIDLWRKSIINHLYWSATSTPDGNGNMMAAKFRAIANHLLNIHTGHEEYPGWTECAHGEIEDRDWMEEGTLAYDKVREIVLNSYLKGSLMKMSPLEQTSNVEAFHYVLCLWAPKLLAFSYAGMKCRNYIAALHWAENGNRDQATRNIDGALQYSVSYPKPKLGEGAVKKVLKPCTYEYVETLTKKAMQLAKDRVKNAKEGMPELKSKPPLCSAYEKVPKARMVEQYLQQKQLSNH